MSGKKPVEDDEPQKQPKSKTTAGADQSDPINHNVDDPMGQPPDSPPNPNLPPESTGDDRSGGRTDERTDERTDKRR